MCAASCAQEDALGDTSSYRILTEIRGCTNSYPSAERAAGAGERRRADIYAGARSRALGRMHKSSKVKSIHVVPRLDLTYRKRDSTLDFDLT